MDEQSGRGGDYLDRMRGLSVAALIAAAVAAIVGSFLEWGHFDKGQDIGDGAFAFALPERVTGVEAGDGWWVIGAGGVILGAALLLLVRKRSIYAWLAFLAAMVMGSLAFADYRDISNISSPLHGNGEVAFGLTLVAGAVVVAVIGALVGVAASPRPPD